MYWSFSSGVGVKFAQSPANGKQGLIPEKKEMSQTALTKLEARKPFFYFTAKQL
jgi:hypothetical protein